MVLWRCIKCDTNLYNFPEVHSNHKSCTCTSCLYFFLFPSLLMKFLKRIWCFLKLIIGKTTLFGFFFINDHFQLFLNQHLYIMKRRLINDQWVSVYQSMWLEWIHFTSSIICGLLMIKSNSGFCYVVLRGWFE